jgi:hypothetical protein
MARGRKPKLTPALQEILCTAILGGLTLSAASALAGMPVDTVLRWIQRGEGRHPTRRATAPYVQFVRALKKVQAEDEARRVARIEDAARGGQVVYEKTTTTARKDGSTVTVREVRYTPPDWTADAWHLERSNPKAWGRRDRIDHHYYKSLIEQKARELADAYGLDLQALLRDAEEWANNARLEDPNHRPSF